MNKIQIFKSNEYGQIRTIMSEQGEPLFVTSDLARGLGYTSAKDMTRMLDEDEKGRQKVPTLGGQQTMTVITESGFYQDATGYNDIAK